MNACVDRKPVATQEFQCTTNNQGNGGKDTVEFESCGWYSEKRLLRVKTHCEGSNLNVFVSKEDQHVLLDIILKNLDLHLEDEFECEGEADFPIPLTGRDTQLSCVCNTGHAKDRALFTVEEGDDCMRVELAVGQSHRHVNVTPEGQADLYKMIGHKLGYNPDVEVLSTRAYTHTATPDEVNCVLVYGCASNDPMAASADNDFLRVQSAGDVDHVKVASLTDGKGEAHCPTWNERVHLNKQSVINLVCQLATWLESRAEEGDEPCSNVPTNESSPPTASLLEYNASSLGSMVVTASQIVPCCAPMAHSVS